MLSCQDPLAAIKIQSTPKLTAKGYCKSLSATLRHRCAAKFAASLIKASEGCVHSVWTIEKFSSEENSFVKYRCNFWKRKLFYKNSKRFLLTPLLTAQCTWSRWFSCKENTLDEVRCVLLLWVFVRNCICFPGRMEKTGLSCYRYL